ncbi:hypothetical protein MTP99_010565 [Tenebrio molitor]|nr:hypothetical protein MTP99_010565 [Tenebrio molitor]
MRRLNPLSNTRTLLRLNPYAAVLKREAILSPQKRQMGRDELLAKKRKITLPDTASRSLFWSFQARGHFVISKMSSAEMKLQPRRGKFMMKKLFLDNSSQCCTDNKVCKIADKKEQATVKSKAETKGFTSCS